MSIEVVIIWLIAGAAAGWIAGMIVKGGGFGVASDIVIGMVGAFGGTVMFHRIGAPSDLGFISVIATAALGAFVLLAVLKIMRV